VNIEQVWAQYRSRIKAFLHSKVSNPDEVDDLLQEILIKSYNKLPDLKSQESVKPWLWQVANNTIIDFYRKNAKSKQLENEPLWFEENDMNIHQQLSKCLEPFIQSLPGESAELLMAIDIQGMSQKDYAQNVGLSYSTLKSRVQKSREALKKVFESCCHYQLDNQGNIVEYERKSSDCKNC